MEFSEKVNTLPKEIKDFLMSNEVRLELERVYISFKAENSKNIGDISKSVGLIFVSDLALENLPNIISKGLGVPENISYGIAYEINKRIFNLFPGHFKNSEALLNKWRLLKSDPQISKEEVTKILLEIEPWILDAEKEKRKQSLKMQQVQESLVKATLSEALKNYPELGEQLITAEKITLHSFPEPVRPSIKNWLADYTFTLGQDKRGAMERSRYLFQNINARNLKGEDRQRLSYILRVYDENLPITINKATRRVIFAAATPEEPAVSPVSAPLPTANPDRSATLDSGVRFSSPQQLPYERKNSSNVSNITRLEEKPKPMPKNVVNLKE